MSVRIPLLYLFSVSLLAVSMGAKEMKRPVVTVKPEIAQLHIFEVSKIERAAKGAVRLVLKDGKGRSANRLHVLATGKAENNR